ncbi:MAG: phosphatase PAP2 family protein [Planctomycetales bacterium]|nr:phosphatase PAP2 family protein [Planctomycetales bacterium]
MNLQQNQDDRRRKSSPAGVRTLACVFFGIVRRNASGVATICIFMMGTLCAGQTLDLSDNQQPVRIYRLPPTDVDDSGKAPRVEEITSAGELEFTSNSTAMECEGHAGGIVDEYYSDDSVWNGGSERGFIRSIVADHEAFYSRRNLGDVALVVAVGGLMANTNIDRFVTFDLYHENVRNANSDEWLENLHKPKFFGDAYHAIPVYGAAMLAGKLFSQQESTQLIGDWGDRSFRTLLVGGPPVLVLQQLTGGSRPGEQDYGSRWRPFADDNGVSGHSFVGAVPFLSAAYMTDNKILRRTLIAASTLPAISRLNDDAHYASQAMMGWSLAFFAANAVNNTELQNSPLQFSVTTLNGSPQLGVTYDW